MTEPCIHRGRIVGRTHTTELHLCTVLDSPRTCTLGSDVPGLPNCDSCELRPSTQAPVNVVLIEFEPIDLPARTSDRVVVSLAIGDRFKQLLSISRPTFTAYASKCQSDYREVLIDSSDYPEGEKFRLSQFFDHGYAEVLFVDADALVMPAAENLFGVAPDADVCIHDDTRFLKRRDWLDSEYRGLIESQGWVVDIKTCYNTGFMLLRDRRAVEMPDKPFPRSHTAEQSMINLQIARHGLKVYELDRKWNEQWWFTGSLPVRPGTFVYHWANAPHATRLKEMLERRDGRKATSKPSFMPCANLGDVIRTDKCEICGTANGPKGTAVQVRKCSVHGECSAARYRQIGQPAICNRGCQSFTELVQLELLAR